LIEDNKNKVNFDNILFLLKPLQAKRKLLSGMLGYADAAIEKVEKLSADVKQYQSERADQEVERMAGEAVELASLSMVAEQEYQYGAEVFEAQQEKVAKAVSESVTSKAVPVVDGKSR
jgi:hypothetical protein